MGREGCAGDLKKCFQEIEMFTRITEKDYRKDISNMNSTGVDLIYRYIILRYQVTRERESCSDLMPKKFSLLTKRNNKNDVEGI